jgi:hypothetical protein
LAVLVFSSMSAHAAGDALKYVPEGRTLDGINLLDATDVPRISAGAAAIGAGR